MSKRDIKAILFALGISTSLSLTGCSETEDTIMFNTLLEDVSDETCIDEILNDKYDNNL